MIKLKSFAPIVNNNSKILVLGSMPSTRSLQKQQYYAHPKNQFWPIIYALFNKPVEPNYDDRINFVLSKGIAIWDVIATCHRTGSLDSNIKGETVNDFKSFFRTYSNIKLIAFNGTKALEVYKKQVGFDKISSEYKQLPSTSPANTTKFEDKLNQWKIILNYL